MASQVTAILLLILGWGPLPWLAPIGHAALWVVMVAAVVSAVDYYRRFQRLVNARVTDVNIARSAKASRTREPRARSARTIRTEQYRGTACLRVVVVYFLSAT